VFLQQDEERENEHMGADGQKWLGLPSFKPLDSIYRGGKEELFIFYFIGEVRCYKYAFKSLQQGS
jgi:hypothetical protein